MAQATENHITLSTMFTDLFVRVAFEAAERDGLAQLAVLNDQPPSLSGGAAAALDGQAELA